MNINKRQLTGTFELSSINLMNKYEILAYKLKVWRPEVVTHKRYALFTTATHIVFQNFIP